jgi:hypothetical protein
MAAQRRLYDSLSRAVQPVDIHNGHLTLCTCPDNSTGAARTAGHLHIASSDYVAALQVIERFWVVGQDPVLGLLADAVHLSEHRDGVEFA